MIFGITNEIIEIPNKIKNNPTKKIELTLTKKLIPITESSINDFQSGENIFAGDDSRIKEVVILMLKYI